MNVCCYSKPQFAQSDSNPRKFLRKLLKYVNFGPNSSDNPVTMQSYADGIMFFKEHFA